MKRLSDWRGRLNSAVNEMMRKPFAWGTHDCVAGMFMPVVRAVTGEDLSGELPAYDSALGAKQALATHGFDGLSALALAHLDEIEPAFARVGDIALVRNEEPGAVFPLAFGVVLGERIGVLKETGYGTVAREMAEQTYRVGQ
jgi:hypothetical protein